MTSIADIIGKTAQASPDSIRSAAHHLSTVASEASTLRGRLLAANPAQWQGEAATRFEQLQQADLPPDLEKLSRSFEACAAALRTYAADVDDVQERARQLAHARDRALDEQRSAAAAASSAKREVGAAKSSVSSAVDPASRAVAQQAVTRATQRLTSASARKGSADESVRSVDLAAARLRATDESNSIRAATAMSAASDAGITNSLLSSLQRHAAPILEEVAKFIEQVAEVVATVATALSVVLLAASLVFPVLAPIAAAVGLVALGAGIIAVVAGVVRYMAAFARPGDTRTFGEKARGAAALAIGGVALLPLRKTGPVGKGLEKRLQRWISAEGRSNPPRVYMNERRRTQQEILETGGDSVLEEGANVVEPDDPRVRAQTDASGVCRPPQASSTYRTTYRYETGPSYA